MKYDLITVGRVSMDLFARDIGAAFHDISAFESGVGGSPVNIAIGASRLGLKSIAFTAVGDDEVGRFVRHYLGVEGVNTDYISVKPGRRTGMAVVGVQPPDKFPLLFYRENPADIHLSIDEATKLPLAEARALSLSGTALSRGGARDCCLYLAEQAFALGHDKFHRSRSAPRSVVASAGLWFAYPPPLAAHGCRHRHRRRILGGALAGAGSGHGGRKRDRPGRAASTAGGASRRLGRGAGAQARRTRPANLRRPLRSSTCRASRWRSSIPLARAMASPVA